MIVVLCSVVILSSIGALLHLVFAVIHRRRALQYAVDRRRERLLTTNLEEQDMWRRLRLRQVVVLLLNKKLVQEGIPVAFRLSSSRKEVHARRNFLRGSPSEIQRVREEASRDLDASMDKEVRRVLSTPLPELLRHGRPPDALQGPDLLQLLLLDREELMLREQALSSHRGNYSSDDEAVQSDGEEDTRGALESSEGPESSSAPPYGSSSSSASFSPPPIPLPNARRRFEKRGARRKPPMLSSLPALELPLPAHPTEPVVNSPGANEEGDLTQFLYVITNPQTARSSLATPQLPPGQQGNRSAFSSMEVSPSTVGTRSIFIQMPQSNERPSTPVITPASSLPAVFFDPIAEAIPTDEAREVRRLLRHTRRQHVTLPSPTRFYGSGAAYAPNAANMKLWREMVKGTREAVSRSIEQDLPVSAQYTSSPIVRYLSPCVFPSTAKFPFREPSVENLDSPSSNKKAGGEGKQRHSNPRRSPRVETDSTSTSPWVAGKASTGSVKLPPDSARGVFSSADNI